MLARGLRAKWMHVLRPSPPNVTGTARAAGSEFRNHFEIVFGDRFGTKPTDQLADELIELLLATVATALRHAEVFCVLRLSGGVGERGVEPKR